MEKSEDQGAFWGRMGMTWNFWSNVERGRMALLPGNILHDHAFAWSSFFLVSAKKNSTPYLRAHFYSHWTVIIQTEVGIKVYQFPPIFHSRHAAYDPLVFRYIKWFRIFQIHLPLKYEIIRWDLYPHLISLVPLFSVLFFVELHSLLCPYYWIVLLFLLLSAKYFFQSYFLNVLWQ